MPIPLLVPLLAGTAARVAAGTAVRVAATTAARAAATTAARAAATTAARAAATTAARAAAGTTTRTTAGSVTRAIARAPARIIKPLRFIGRPYQVALKSGLHRILRSKDKNRAKKPIGGVFWWIILCVCIFADLMDILTTLIELVALVTVLGMPVSFFFHVMDAIFDSFVSALCNIYYFAADARMARTIALAMLGWGIEQVPFLEVLPTMTLMFVLVRVIENKERVQPEPSSSVNFSYAHS